MIMPKTGRPNPEFSRILEVSELAHGPVERIVEANSDEREALARRLGVRAIESLRSTMVIRPIGALEVKISGRIQAIVEQACVVTLAPVVTRLDEAFEVLYAAPALVEETEPGDMEIPERIENGLIDLGEEVVQQLACLLNPYPRAPGAEVPAKWRGGDENGPTGPFSKLAEISKKTGNP